VNDQGTEIKSGEYKSVSDLMVAKLEELTLYAKAIGKDTREHRDDFATFRGEVNTKFAVVNGRIDVLNVQMTNVESNSHTKTSTNG